MNKTLCTIMLELKGVPKTGEDHLYLCRFPDHHPIVSKLKDGYEISIIEHDPPIIKGLKLKKYGIHLVYEDDDYDGDEESLDESQLSISEKLSSSALCKRKRTPLNLIVKLKAKFKRSRKKKKEKDLSLYSGTFCGLCKGALAH